MNNGGKKLKILFVCIGNMCRSPMAEGFAREMGGGAIESHSAGTMASGVVSPDSITVMREVGINISEQTSKGVDQVPLEEMDVVVNMSGWPADSFLPPTFEGQVIDWTVEDPVGDPVVTYSRVRDELQARVRSLLDELGV
jgi:arsenate reductase